MRSRMAIKKSGVICELREVSLNNKPDAMIAISPKGTVPILQLSDGTILDESLDIMHWALSIKDPDYWLEEIDEAKILITELDNNFKKALDKYKYCVRYPEHSQIHYRELGEKFLRKLEDNLIKNHGKGLCNTRITLIDIAVFPFIRQFAFVDKSWFDKTPYTLLKKWLINHLDSHLFLSIMVKNPPWKPYDKIIYF
tara:strand:- start:250 stop:840 length:591 start_codon:yes stop_codon:yes gene_type:complete